MSSYKVKLGEQIVTVDGLAGLVKLVQEGRLSPEDPVFIPSTNRWHYARSVRQLREYFPGTPEPPRVEPEKPKEKKKPPIPAPVPSPPPPARPEAPGDNLVQFRQGSWNPDGRIEVPVFSYDVDAAESPPGALLVRRLLIVGGALFVGSMIYVYVAGYSQYLKSFEQSIELETPAPVRATPTPRKTAMAKAKATAGAKGTAVTMATTAAPKSTTPTPAPTATPGKSFDERAALEKVRRASTTRVTKPADLGSAIKKDLTKLAVPVRTLSFVPKKGVKGASIPFVGVVEYVRGEKTDEATAAKHRYMIIAMIGRRATELNLRLDAVQLASIKGKTRSETRVSADLTKRIWEGTASAADLP